VYALRRDEIRAAIEEALEGGRYILGPSCAAFETEFATWLGSVGSIGVANGTDAVELCLRSFGLPAKSNVAVPAHTAVATATAVVRAGHAPVFIDIDPNTFTMNPDALREACKAHLDLAAVIPVHLYGQPCDMTAIAAIADDYGMSVLEDCSQAHGATCGGRKVGTIGRAAAFSCYPTKNLGAIGDAGVVASNDETLLAHIRFMRQYGWRDRYVSDEVGMNSRLDELQAAILRVQLRHLDADNARRRMIAERYNASLDGMPLALPPIPDAPQGHAFHQYTILTPMRGELQAALAANGVLTAILYPKPIHRMPAYAEYVRRFGSVCPVADRVCEELLCLPIHPALDDGDVDLVVTGIRAFFAAAA
jgi:dTDP-4-amino-4,6-dideoxygalactose transaminase